MVRPSVNTPDCVTLNAGGSLHYPNAAWNATSGQTGGGFGLRDNDISSIKVGSGATIQIFYGTSFGGTSSPFTVDVPLLMGGADNQISSIKVF